MNEGEEEDQQAERSLLSNFVNVISGAKKSATVEFDKFCENIGWKAKPTPVIVHNKHDIARIQARQSIHGRILPDEYRHIIGKDVEIQTDEFPPEELESYKRRLSSSDMSVDRLSEEYRPVKMNKSRHTPVSPIKERHKSASPIKERHTEHTKFSKESDTEHSVANANNSSNAALTSLINDYNDYMDIEPRNSITNSSKSVKRLTSELEKIFSAQHPPTFKKAKTEHKTEQKEPETEQAYVPKAERYSTKLTEKTWEPKTKRRSVSSAESLASIIEGDIRGSVAQTGTTTTQVPPPPPPPLLPSMQREIEHKQASFNASEKLRFEEERMLLLEKKLGDIHYQMNSFVDRNSNQSPIPSHTILGPQPIAISPMSASPMRPASSLRSVSPINNSAATPIRNTLNLTSSPQINNFHTSSPVRDLISHIQGSSSPIPKPTEKHISKMRVLIQQIPMFQLRKTDTIIGPDGEEKPNPIWHEIYGKRRTL
ncbi:hypothetical protein BY458DRAFT_487283 [Sporodiniella umbellata]|nr:hypothetical protein BY458DRAFT_487283 [Sporodiniella umbellata]